MKILLLLAFACPRQAVAQGTVTALTLGPGSGIVDYAPQGVGWSFVPASDLLVTGINSTAPQVDFWSGTNQNIASYSYAGPYASGRDIGSIGAPTKFQTIPPLFLSAGQLYFISTQQTNFSSYVNVLGYSLNGTNGMTAFRPAHYLDQVASYFMSSNGDWSPITTPASENRNYVFLGPNFQFQVVPEPSSIRFAMITIGAAVLHKTGRLKFLP